MYNKTYEIKHYGTPRHSGRYPYGSGERPYQEKSKIKQKERNEKKNK